MTIVICSQLYSALLTSYGVWAWQRDNFLKFIFI